MVCLFSQSGKKIQVNSSKEKGREKNPAQLQFFSPRLETSCEEEKRGAGVGKRCFGVFSLLGSPPRCFDQLLFPLLCQKFIKKKSPQETRPQGSAFIYRKSAAVGRVQQFVRKPCVCVCFSPF